MAGVLTHGGGRPNVSDQVVMVDGSFAQPGQPDRVRRDSGWKMVKQLRDSKEFVKQTFGVGAALGLLATVLSIFTLLYAILKPAMDQAHLNGAVDQALKNYDANRATDRQAATDNTATVRNDLQQIRNDMQQVLTAGQQAVVTANRTGDDVRQMGVRFDQQFIELRQKSDALWNWNGKLENKLALLEGKIDAARKQ